MQESGYEINVRPFVLIMPQITSGLGLQLFFKTHSTTLFFFKLRLPPGKKVRDQPVRHKRESAAATNQQNPSTSGLTAVLGLLLCLVQYLEKGASHSNKKPVRGLYRKQEYTYQ